MTRRSKITVIVALIVVCAVLVGVGFAAWLIADSAKGSADGNLQAESVKDGSLSEDDFKLSGVAEKNIYFTHPRETSNPGAWLKTDGQGEAEKLEETFEFVISRKVKTLKITWSLLSQGGTFSLKDGGADNGFDSAVSRGYITRPTLTLQTPGESFDFSGGVNGEAALLTRKSNVAASDDKETLVIKITFGWGAHFGGQNPYLYYNAQAENAACAGGYALDGGALDDRSSSSTYRQDAEASLAELEALLRGCKFRLTFEAKADAA